uniref:Uncharacterized protein n=1 Tax=Timspurckia oligopyrenoides TaxID=708627 RepID=A0A7S1ETN5_9RHOD|mmetsp:Transcript_6479/g.11571  ORF Transcript_6479/g.11571 Transcript_6479/m.11571 type:complete len:115 (+) Transcript_6479:153-497(+)
MRQMSMSIVERLGMKRSLLLFCGVLLFRVGVLLRDWMRDEVDDVGFEVEAERCEDEAALRSQRASGTEGPIGSSNRLNSSTSCVTSLLNNMAKNVSKRLREMSVNQLLLVMLMP